MSDFQEQNSAGQQTSTAYATGMCPCCGYCFHCGGSIVHTYPHNYPHYYQPYIWGGLGTSIDTQISGLAGTYGISA